jgi:hypothetical protein
MTVISSLWRKISKITVQNQPFFYLMKQLIFSYHTVALHQLPKNIILKIICIKTIPNFLKFKILENLIHIEI